jgi:hypothetical protein
MKTTKTIIFITVLLITIITAQAQNLVPNPSFEEYISCPSDYGQTFLAGWTININTADYYHKCANELATEVGIPYNTFGIQDTYNSNCMGYAGFGAFFVPVDFSEYIGIQLYNPLIIGIKYFVSLKIVLANSYSVNCGVNKIGIKFTNYNYGQVSAGYPASVMNNSAHVYTEDVITEQNDWVDINGSFIADSTYQFIIIGRFFNDNNTTVDCFGDNLFSYYYIDDDCVSTDSAFCWDYVYNCTSSIEDKIVNKPEFTLSPNPANDHVYIQMKNDMFQIVKSVELYTMQGANVTGKVQILNNENCGFTLKRNNLNEGIYILKIQTLNNQYCTKLIFN